MIHRCQNIFFGNCERWLRKLRKVFMIMQHFFFFFFFPETELKKKKYEVSTHLKKIIPL